MDSLIFDVIGYSEALQEAGMPKKQADLIAKTQEARIDAVVRARDLATRQDLAEMELRLRAEIQKSHNTMLSWVAGLIVAQTTFIVTALAWLLK